MAPGLTLVPGSFSTQPAELRYVRAGLKTRTTMERALIDTTIFTLVYFGKHRLLLPE